MLKCFFLKSIIRDIEKGSKQSKCVHTYFKFKIKLYLNLNLFIGRAAQTLLKKNFYNDVYKLILKVLFIFLGECFYGAVAPFFL